MSDISDKLKCIFPSISHVHTAIYMRLMDADIAHGEKLEGKHATSYIEQILKVTIYKKSSCSATYFLSQEPFK